MPIAKKKPSTAAKTTTEETVEETTPVAEKKAPKKAPAPKKSTKPAPKKTETSDKAAPKKAPAKKATKPTTKTTEEAPAKEAKSSVSFEDLHKKFDFSFDREASSVKRADMAKLILNNLVAKAEENPTAFKEIDFSKMSQIQALALYDLITSTILEQLNKANSLMFAINEDGNPIYINRKTIAARVFDIPAVSERVTACNNYYMMKLSVPVGKNIYELDRDDEGKYFYKGTDTPFDLETVE